MPSISHLFLVNLYVKSFNHASLSINEPASGSAEYGEKRSRFGKSIFQDLEQSVVRIDPLAIRLDYPSSAVLC